MSRSAEVLCRTAVAIYHSNRGAELLLAGKLDESLAHLRRAVAGASSGTLHALCESWLPWAGTPFYAAARR